MSPRSTVLVPAILAAACAGEHPPGWEGTVTDSAGVTVVANPVVPVWGAEESRWVDEELRIPLATGWGEDPERLPFITHGSMGPDGELHLVDRWTGQVRTYDRSGEVRAEAAPGDAASEAVTALREARAAEVDALAGSALLPARPGSEGAPPVVGAVAAWSPRPGRGAARIEAGAAEVILEDGRGGERRVRSDGWLARPPTAADEAFLLQLLVRRRILEGEASGGNAEAEAAFPAYLPALTDVEVAPDGSIWVQRMGAVRHVHPLALGPTGAPGRWGGTVWDVLDRQGRYLGSVEFPPRTRILEIGDQEILAVQTTPDYRDEIVVFRLNGEGGS